MLDKIVKTFFASAIVFALVFNVSAVQAEQIDDYKVHSKINIDSSVEITEVITYNFGDLQKHGIFRNIPYEYETDEGTFKLRLSDFEVWDGSGNPLSFDKSKSGGYVELKIGDPDKYVTGVQVYQIKYKVKRAVEFFESHDEFYWDAIGDEWTIPIQKSYVAIESPGSITQAVCYTGVYESTEQGCQVSGVGSSKVAMSRGEVLNPGEGFTIVIGVNKGVLVQPTWKDRLLDTIIDNYILVWPLIVFVILFYFWNKYGRDAKRKNSVVAQYDAPDNLSPLYVGSLLKGKVDNSAITAEVVFLAEQGYLTIKRLEYKKLVLFTGVDYEFTKVEKPTDKLAPQTKALYDKIFNFNRSTVKLSDLKSEVTFGQELRDIKSKTTGELTKSGYFVTNPVNVKAVMFLIMMLAGFGGTFLFVNFFGLIGGLASVLGAVVIFVFMFLMPARTSKGVEAVGHIMGLENYMTVAEKDRMAFHNAPKKSPQIFEQLLPFAIALGVDKAWSEQFKDLTKAPSWYTDASNASFNSAIFTSSMRDFSSSMSSAVSSMTTSSSGGSGFSGGGSGGGGGGGGGGSW